MQHAPTVSTSHVGPKSLRHGPVRLASHSFCAHTPPSCLFCANSQYRQQQTHREVRPLCTYPTFCKYILSLCPFYLLLPSNRPLHTRSLNPLDYLKIYSTSSSLSLSSSTRVRDIWLLLVSNRPNIKSYQMYSGLRSLSL
jgi:hypothetical protein